MTTNVDDIYHVRKALGRKALGQHMIARGKGKIIAIGSVQCELTRPEIASYTAAKGAVRNLTIEMCGDWAQYGQINTVASGYFDTPLNEALVRDAEIDAWLWKRTPASEDSHGVAVLFASSASDFINGQTSYVDGGITAVI